MEGRMKPIGGEFWFDKKLFCDKVSNFRDLYAVFLSGGQSAIQFILDDIKFKSDEYVLVPSYLCPTILYSFQRRNINYMFYEINEDLSINLKDIEGKINSNKVKALFFIDYFGFYHADKTIEFLKSIKRDGVILIEDAVQMFWFKRMNKFIGDYIFNSYRKFLPIDGSIVLCNRHDEFNYMEDNYCKLMNKARTKKTRYVQNDIGKEEEFLNLFSIADKAYYERKNIIGMDDQSKKLLDKVDYKLIGELRRENYNYLYDILINFSNIKILFNKQLIEDNVPLTFPILIHNRDSIRKKLRESFIYCPVHWDVRNESWIDNFKKSKKISNSILSLPIDWRYNKEDINFLIKKIVKNISFCKTKVKL